MRAAVSTGCTLWNGGEFYGTDAANSMTLMRRYFAEYPDDAEKVVVCIKGGVDQSSGRPRPDGSAAQMCRSMDNILTQIGGAKTVDMFECARRDPGTPLEETFGLLNEYVEAGKLGGIALSEVSAATIHEAACITKIIAVEVELSLLSTAPLENGIAAACAQHNIPLIAYSPLGMGMLAGRFKSPDDIPQDDHRRVFPRFQPESFHVNFELVRRVEDLAAKRGCTPAQLAVGGEMLAIVPIPDATTERRVGENLEVVELSDKEMAEIEDVLGKFEVAGGRWPAGLPVET